MATKRKTSPAEALTRQCSDPSTNLVAAQQLERNLTPSAHSYVIVDLDGCIADDRHRRALIDPEAADPWAGYHDGCYADRLANGSLLRTIEAAGWRLIVFTARPERLRSMTMRWLSWTAKITPHDLFMRQPHQAHLSSPELKSAFLDELFAGGEVILSRVVLVVDDRLDVLAMYRRRGLNALRIEVDESPAATRPGPISGTL